MSRTWGQPFHTEAMAGLTRQLAFAPAEQRVRQVESAERLHDELEAETTYPMSFLVYRVTGTRRSAKLDELLIVGRSAAHDLRLLIDRLSRTVSLGEPLGGAVSPKDLAAELGTSLKTITRWRSGGLRWRWMPGEGGERHRVMICRSAVEAYTRSVGSERVARAASFTRTEPATVRRILADTRRLARRRAATLNQVAARVAELHGRGLETVRQIIQRHDRERPDEAIFPDRQGPLTDRQRRVIERAHGMGIEAARIAERYGRSLSTVYRVLAELRAERLRERPIAWVDLAVFDRPDAEAVILRQPFHAVDWTAGRSPIRPEADGLPDWLIGAATRPTLTADDCRSLLVRMNYLRRHAAELRDALPPREPGKRAMDRVEGWLDEADAVARLVYASHLPRLLAIARRQWQSQASAGAGYLVQWVALGAPVLQDAIATHNPSRTQPFDAYFVNRLLQAYARPTSGRAASAKQRRRAETELGDRLASMGLMTEPSFPPSGRRVASLTAS
ncbi:MAG: hypothetical protein AAGI54_06180 [Planctomycetota bacterium]